MQDALERILIALAVAVALALLALGFGRLRRAPSPARSDGARGRARIAFWLTVGLLAGFGAPAAAQTPRTRAGGDPSGRSVRSDQAFRRLVDRVEARIAAWRRLVPDALPVVAERMKEALQEDRAALARSLGVPGRARAAKVEIQGTDPESGDVPPPDPPDPPPPPPPPTCYVVPPPPPPPPPPPTCYEMPEPTCYDAVEPPPPTCYRGYAPDEDKAGKHPAARVESAELAARAHALAEEIDRILET